MYVLPTCVILLCALPGLRSAIRAAKEPKEEHCTGAAVGLFLLTAASTAFLLTLLFLNNLF